MSRTGCRLLAAGVLAVALLPGTRAPLEAQYPWEGFDWSARTLRTSGAPVVPSFEGWYQEPEGTYRLCFGYWSGNTEAEVDIPLGPDNFIEPKEFDGGQPTHFMPVPRTGYRKHYCVHTVQVPEDFGNGRVVWTLRVGGQEYSVPGHLTSTAYMLDEPDSESRALAWDFLAEEMGVDDYSQIADDDEAWLDFNPGQAQGSIAPLVRWIQPEGPEGRGRIGLYAGPVTVPVGDPLTLSVFVDEPNGRPARWWVGWSKYSGPGDAKFSQLEMLADYRYDNRATTRVTFSEPGDYVVLMQSIENIQSFERQCCWTNGYARVTVTP
ncbi:MAG: hypothetical protein O3A47_11765 [Chloroflexi bacterium]|nr:hypothetical protein [Chloroflexota bacterium]